WCTFDRPFYGRNEQPWRYFKSKVFSSSTFIQSPNRFGSIIANARGGKNRVVRIQTSLLPVSITQNPGMLPNFLHLVWEVNTGAGIFSSPSIYMVNGKEFVTLASGGGREAVEVAI